MEFLRQSVNFAQQQEKFKTFHAVEILHNKRHNKIKRCCAITTQERQ